ncbi:MAG: multidrug transporter [Ruminococcus sp.]|nr:multidrug transporter [Ruminococcus sp.]
MYQVIEKDWKLFRKLLPGWQEAYMERLAKEYIELLSSDRQASDKFWELDQRIKQDKRRTGVLARGVSRSNMFQLIINLIYEEAISEEDLKEFSEDLRDTVKTRLEIDRRYFM